MADLDIGMEKAVLKKLLGVSKKDPVHCAVGVSKGMGVILLDKIKPSKTLSKDLEKKFADIKNPRWGTASVDVEEDPKLVILILNKPAPGLARALKKSLKPAGYSKVEIRDEEGNVAETEGDEEEEQAEAGAAPTSQAPAEEQPQAAAQRPPQEETAAAPDHAAAAEEQTQAAAPPAQQEDPAALTKELTDLIKQVVAAIGADPSRGATLKGLAAGATTDLKSGDLAGARSGIDALRAALAQASAAAAPANGAGGPPNAPALGKAKQAWTAARKKVESELGKLHAEMTDHYKDSAFATQLDQVFSSKIEPILIGLDETLSEKLDAVLNNTDPSQHNKLVADARQTISQYESYLEGEPMIAKLDSNPFVPLAIQKTMAATLAALSRVVA